MSTVVISWSRGDTPVGDDCVAAGSAAATSTAWRQRLMTRRPQASTVAGRDREHLRTDVNGVLLDFIAREPATVPLVDRLRPPRRIRGPAGEGVAAGSRRCPGETK